MPPHGASHVVRLEIPTLSGSERTAIAAASEPIGFESAEASYVVDGEAVAFTDHPVGERWRNVSRTSGASVLGEALGGFTTDAVFAVADPAPATSRPTAGRKSPGRPNAPEHAVPGKNSSSGDSSP